MNTPPSSIEVSSPPHRVFSGDADESLKERYAALMTVAKTIFVPGELDRLAPRSRNIDVHSKNGHPLAAFEPLAATECIAYEFLGKGGKFARPFITLGTLAALRPDLAVNGSSGTYRFSDAVKRTAISIESFHKASLVHDDIEDEDLFRYGDATLHRKYGTATAINVGDYLIGLGYRLVARDARDLGPEVAADILDYLSEAHIRLAEGQGAELVWRESKYKKLSLDDALGIYELKTSPAFEAAMLCGARLAGEAGAYRLLFRTFCREMGNAFQILNDLDDWQGDDHNKLEPGGDLLGGRPTVLWALAQQQLSDSAYRNLVELITDQSRSSSDRLMRARDLFAGADVFQSARHLVDQARKRALETTSRIDCLSLQQMLRFLLAYLVDRRLDPKDVPAKG